MTEPELIAKATTQSNQSEAVVVSFASEWYDLLKAKQFTAVIRKRIPKTLRVQWIYFHINSPVSALCARAEVQGVCDLTLPQAKQIASALALSETEIASYFSDNPSVGCYRLGKITLARPELNITTVHEHMVYHAPQSFFILSFEAKKVIDRLAGFPD